MAKEGVETVGVNTILNNAQSNEYLIELAFPSGTVSRIGSRERYLHGQTPHSLFVWWARRPYSAMRPVVFSSLLPVTKGLLENELNTADRLASSVEPLPGVVEEAKRALLKSYGHAPRVLDIFGGGGTIALEAGRLGCEADSIDINPVAFFIQKCILEFSQQRQDLPEIVWTQGTRILEELKKETQSIFRRDFTKYPSEQRLAFLWGRTVRCGDPSCQKTISLSGNWLISTKKKHRALLAEHADKLSGNYERELSFEPGERVQTTEWKTTKGVICPFCGRSYPRKQFQELAKASLGDDLLCVRVASGNSKTYVLPTPLESFYPSQDELYQEIHHELKLIGSGLPEVRLPDWSGVVNPPLYGMKTYPDLFNSRQLVVLLKMIRALRELHKDLIESGFSSQESLAITSSLSGLIDQLVDWNCRLSMWIEENQQVGRALSGPGIPMLWRYAEIDPFMLGPANLYDKLKRIFTSLKSIPRFAARVHAHQCSATNLPFANQVFDAVVTDPAYGDNLFYSVLSECIYVWKRLAFEDILPQVFGRQSIPTEDEIVASTHRMTFSEAMSFYEDRLTLALHEAARVLKKGGIMSLFFTHGTIEAWGLIIRAFRSAGFEIRAFWPLLLERKARPRGINSKAVNVSSIIVARHATEQNKAIDWNEIEREMDSTLAKYIEELNSQRWKEEDVALGCFVKAVGIVARHPKITDNDKVLPLEDCIKRCETYTSRKLPTLSLKTR